MLTRFLFVGLDEFLSTHLRRFVEGKKELKVLFATYNNVAHYDSGEVRTGKKGLTIEVRNGNLDYSPESSMIFSPILSQAFTGMRIMQNEAGEAQSTVESSVNIDPKDAADLVAVIYVGLAAFDQAVSMARRIKQENPAARIILTTCDCDTEGKAERLSPLLENKEIDAAVVDSDCGGRGMMEKILKKFIECWPS